MHADDLTQILGWTAAIEFAFLVLLLLQGRASAAVCAILHGKIEDLQKELLHYKETAREAQATVGVLSSRVPSSALRALACVLDKDAQPFVRELVRSLFKEEEPNLATFPYGVDILTQFVKALFAIGPYKDQLIRHMRKSSDLKVRILGTRIYELYHVVENDEYDRLVKFYVDLVENPQTLDTKES